MIRAQGLKITENCRLRLKGKGHGDGIVVGVGKAGVDNSSRADGHIIRHQEAVHSDHILPTVVGGVGVAAAGDGVILIQGGDLGNVLPAEQLCRYGLGPGVVPGTDAEDLIGVPQQVLIKVAAADTVIAFSYSACMSSSSISICLMAMVPSEV